MVSHDLNDMYDISGMETGDTEGHTFQGQCLLRCDRGDVIKLYYNMMLEYYSMIIL